MRIFVTRTLQNLEPNVNWPSYTKIKSTFITNYDTMKHDKRMIAAIACAPAVAIVPVLVVSAVEASVVNGLVHSPGKGTPQLAHSAAVV